MITEAKLQIVDRIVATIKGAALILSLAYFLLNPSPERADVPTAFIVTTLSVSAVIETIQVVGVWLHKRWGFGLTSGLYFFGMIGSLFIFPIVDHITGKSERSLVNWHDVYALPIAIYCAYRFLDLRGKHRSEA
ncbi:MAG: hypothetical protein M3R13_05735 [Armatimonadota bacterium]|nr:hypothetical protein [Armatimonadota bacterium]